MIRQALIEQIQRQLSGGYINDDSNFTIGLVNQLIDEGVAVAAKQNYKDNFQLEAIGFVNNSFYTTFKGLAVVEDENLIWKVTLPQLPIGIGRNEGIETLKFKDVDGKLSLPCVPISSNQASFFQTMRPIPNKILFKPEGNFLFALSPILLKVYTASVTMISGGDSTDLTSTLNVPNDYVPIIITYVQQQLLLEKQQVRDLANDGVPNK